MTDEASPGWTVDPELRANLRLAAVRAAIAREDFDEAVIEVEELLDEAPDHPEGLFLLAECLLEQGDAELALGAYERRLTLPGVDARVWTGLAISRFDLCDVHGAAEAAREAVRLSPDIPEAHYYLGLALERLEGRKAESVSALLAAHRLDPEAYPIPVDGDPEQWERVLRRAIHMLDLETAAFWEDVVFVFYDVPDLSVLLRASPPIPPTVPGLFSAHPAFPPPEDPEAPREMYLYTNNLARLGHWEDIVEHLLHLLTQEAELWLDFDPPPYEDEDEDGHLSDAAPDQDEA